MNQSGQLQPKKLHETPVTQGTTATSSEYVGVGSARGSRQVQNAQNGQVVPRSPSPPTREDRARTRAIAPPGLSRGCVPSGMVGQSVVDVGGVGCGCWMLGCWMLAAWVLETADRGYNGAPDRPDTHIGVHRCRVLRVVFEVDSHSQPTPSFTCTCGARARAAMRERRDPSRYRRSQPVAATGIPPPRREPEGRNSRELGARAPRGYVATTTRPPSRAHTATEPAPRRALTSTLSVAFVAQQQAHVADEGVAQFVE